MKYLLLIILSNFIYSSEMNVNLDGSQSVFWRNWNEAPIRTKNGCCLKLLLPIKKDEYCYFYTLRGDFHDRINNPLFKEIVIDGVPLKSYELEVVNGPIDRRYLYRIKFQVKSESPDFLFR